MTITLKNTKLSGRLSLWKIATSVVLIATAMGSAGEQSTFRFVGPLEDTPAPVAKSTTEQANVSDVIVLAAPKRPATTEFRFLDASMDVAAAKTVTTEAKNNTVATEPTSTLTLSKVSPQPAAAAPSVAKTTGDSSLEFRFVDAAVGASAKAQKTDVVASAEPAAPVRPRALDLGKTAFSDGLVAVPTTAAAAPVAEAKATPAARREAVASVPPEAQSTKSLLVASKPTIAPTPAADLSASLTKAGNDAVSSNAQAKGPHSMVSPFAATPSTSSAPLVADNPPQLNIPILPVVESPVVESAKIAAVTPEPITPVEINPVATPVVTPEVVAVSPPQVRDLTTDLTQANSAAVVASRPQLPSALKTQFAMSTSTKEQPAASAAPTTATGEADEVKAARDFAAKLVSTPNESFSRQPTLSSPSFSYLAAADDAKSAEKVSVPPSAAPPIPTPPSQPPAMMADDSKPEPNRDSMGGLHPVYGGPVGGSGRCGCPYGPLQSGAESICGIDCGRCGAPCSATWKDTHCIPWSMFGPGEYVGPARSEHVSTYYLRVNDLLTLTYITSRKKNAESYRIGVGDRLQIEWLKIASNTDVPLNRELLVQPDGTVSLPLIGEVPAAGKTVTDFQDEITKLFSKYQREPQITVTPLDVNVGLRDVINAVTSVSGSNGQSQALRVTPEGTIQAPGLGSVYAQGLTLDELRSELEARYATTFGPGLLVSPSLTERATSYVFMGGEVRTPGRYTLEGPTTVMQAVTLAGGWNNGGNLHQVVVFRRDENWCLKATKIDVRAPFYGHDPCPVNDVWLRDNDLVIVPKERILCAANVIELYFTRGVYAVFPITFVKDFSTGSAITPIP